MMNNNNAATSSFFQRIRVVFGFIFELRSLSRHREIQAEEAAAAAVAVVGKEDDLETGPAESVEETNVQTNNNNRAVFKKALSILPAFPASFLLFTLPGLYALLQIKWQLPHLVFLHMWFIVCVTSLITEFVASIAQWIIYAAGIRTIESQGF